MKSIRSFNSLFNTISIRSYHSSIIINNANNATVTKPAATAATAANAAPIKSSIVNPYPGRYSLISSRTGRPVILSTGPSALKSITKQSRYNSIHTVLSNTPILLFYYIKRIQRSELYEPRRLLQKHNIKLVKFKNSAALNIVNTMNISGLNKFFTSSNMIGVLQPPVPVPASAAANNTNTAAPIKHRDYSYSELQQLVRSTRHDNLIFLGLYTASNQTIYTPPRLELSESIVSIKPEQQVLSSLSQLFNRLSGTLIAPFRPLQMHYNKENLQFKKLAKAEAEAETKTDSSNNNNTSEKKE